MNEKYRQDINSFLFEQGEKLREFFLCYHPELTEEIVDWAVEHWKNNSGVRIKSLEEKILNGHKLEQDSEPTGLLSENDY